MNDEVVSDSISEDQIAAAEAYEQLHVPALFRQWVEPVLDAAEVKLGQRVLDVACGTGVLARESAGRVGPEGFVVGVDIDEGMLTVAERLNPSIDWRQGSAESLPFADDTFDAVVSQFGLMFFRDRRQSVREMLRVLAPGGKVAVAVWDSLEHSAAYRIGAELLDRIGGKAAGDALRAPFVLGDRDELTHLFESAGVESVGVVTSTGTARFPSIKTMVEADLRGWLPVMGVSLTEPQIDLILAEAENELGEYVTEGGRVEFDAPAHIVTGKKPT